MVNPSGKNGHGAKNYPSDDVLLEALTDYARQNLKPQQKLDHLKDDHNLIIKQRTLRSLEKKFGVQTVRRNNLTAEEKRQAVLDATSGDIGLANGPDFYQNKLHALGIPISVDEITNIMRENNPSGFDNRFPGKNKKKQVPRAQLESIGPFREISTDGHEKLAEQGLRMGGVTLPIYGAKDKWSAALLYLKVLPQVRKPGPIGHVFLDIFEDIGGVPIQVTMDKGSERGWVHALQTTLRALYSPDIDPAVYRDIVFLKSVHNTVIEAFWRWLREKKGDELKIKVTRGERDHIFNINAQNHEELFYWMFPPLVQAELDEFKRYWNSHTIRHQSEKLMLSGHVPNNALRYPEHYAGQSCLIPVPQGIFDAAREYLSEEEGLREDCFRWVNADFERKAEEVYRILGSPTVNLDTCWDVFQQMSDFMELHEL